MPSQATKIEIRNNLNHNVFIVWKPEYQLKLPIVDEQHRGIVSTINSLYFGMQNKHGKEMLQPVIDMVYDYTRVHFEVEEDFLKRCGYPKLDHHHELHDKLTHELVKVSKQSIWDGDPFEFLQFLKNWWIDHICVEDRVFTDYLLKI